MENKLIEQLQKIREEDLFPEATPEDLKVRKQKREGELQKRLKGLKVGDEVQHKEVLGAGTITKIDFADSNLPIFVSSFQRSSYWASPEEIERVNK